MKRRNDEPTDGYKPLTKQTPAHLIGMQSVYAELTGQRLDCPLQSSWNLREPLEDLAGIDDAEKARLKLRRKELGLNQAEFNKRQVRRVSDAIRKARKAKLEAILQANPTA